MSARFDRWDRDRFERARGGGPAPGPERDYYRFEEREQMGPRRSETMVMEDRRPSMRGPPGRFEERERYIEEDRYAPAARPPPRFLDEPIPAEVARQALAPYRKPRPQFLRRQSSLDTFDRGRVQPRYGDEYRMPAEVPIPLPIRRHASPPRGRYFEEFEERYRDSDDEYRDVRIREERRGDHRSKSRMRSRSVMRRRGDSFSSEESFEEVNKGSVIGRKGRTKMPKKLAHKSAIIELGYPFVEEGEFIMVQRALDKEHIDKIVETSKKYREDKSVTYKYEGKGDPPKEKKEEKKDDKKEEKKEEVKIKETKPDGTKVEEKIKIDDKKEEKKEEKKEGGAPPPPPAAHGHGAPPPPPAAPVASTELVKKTTTTTIIDPPDHHHRHQDLAVMVPRPLSEREIRREIKALEAERQALKLERAGEYRLAAADRLRDGDWEIIERDDRAKKEIYRVERNRRGRMALVRSAH
ncbi:hypothetical protein BT63DRAFT_451235 [Microthyrium microscopicum]|uniref:DUF8035 domain-containing protein n=1 Tax=Microthyrium microscopicum TaxID=703497 RepID=A0A6A6UP05_9PEZI|nr:hypothetical protein BT63DRAFT_451235 [Microthyrium microscopicum]